MAAPVENDRPTRPQSAPLDEAERLLAEQGHDLGIARARVAVGRSGIAVGFPRDPMLHVSWWVLSAVAALAGALVVRRRRNG